MSSKRRPPGRAGSSTAPAARVDKAYGVAFHSTVLDALGVDAADIDAMRVGLEPNDPVHAAVYAFARDVAAQRGKVTDEVVRRAHDAGLTDAELLQLVAECVFAGLVGIVDNLAGRVPLDEFLQPQAWNAG